MGKIFYVMGKSAAGKDTIYNRLLQDSEFEFQTIVGYTTRPMREGEQEGKEYHFVTTEMLRELERAGKLIEQRVYQTVHGPWTYATVDDGSIDFEGQNYLLIGTLESYEKLVAYFGSDRLVPIYIEIDDYVRLSRALEREHAQSEPKYAELCRRFLADAEDFSEEKLKKVGIHKRFQNLEMEACIQEIRELIKTT
jgi:guanylate kinase